MQCDLCDEWRDVEALGFDHRDRPDTDDIWRVARICSDCRDDKLMPTLRHLFSDGAINLSESDVDDGVIDVPKPLGAVFRTFESDSGTTHITRSVESGPALGWRLRCVAECGVSAFDEPEVQQRPIRDQEEAVICGRCERIRPETVTSE